MSTQTMIAAATATPELLELTLPELRAARETLRKEMLSRGFTVARRRRMSAINDAITTKN